MARRTTKAPVTGEQSGQQGFLMGPGMVGGPEGLMGGTFAASMPLTTCLSGFYNPLNPCGYPGWGSLYLGTYWTYRFMLEHPTLRHARSIVTDPVIDSTWVAKPARDGVPEERVKLIQSTVLPLRPYIIPDALRCLDYGWAGFEKVWDYRGGYWVVTRSKPLLHDWTRIVVDQGGNFDGLSQGAAGGLIPLPSATAVPNLDRLKSWIITYDREAGNLYGRGRLENIRNIAWAGWLDVAQQLQRLGVKVSGVQPIIKVPSGTFKDKDGKEVSYRDNAQQAVQHLVNGQGVVLTNLALRRAGPGGDTQKVDPELLAALAKASLIEVEVLDFGNQTPAVMGLLERLKHFEGLMFQGWLRSPRTGQESKHGSRADSEQHTAVGDRDCQLVAKTIDLAVSEGIVDDILELNFGPDARGSVVVETPPLVDTTVDESRQFIADLAASNQIVAQRLADTIDIDDLLERGDLKSTKKWAATQAIADAAQKNAEAAANKNAKPLRGGKKKKPDKKQPNDSSDE